MILDPKDASSFSFGHVQRIIDYMEANLLEELTPAIIASHFSVSVSALSSLFKIVCGMTVMEYIRNRRLTLAAEELSSSNIPIINLAYKYGYETPEAFTKAFSRFHGFPPSFIRRGFPISKVFLPMQVKVIIQGGWDAVKLTKSNCSGQESSSLFHYNSFIGSHTNTDVHARLIARGKTGGNQMRDQNNRCQIDTGTMQFQKEWDILCSLAENLLQNHIPFKIDGKTMIFAHGLEFPLEKICLTFKWGDEEEVKYFFRYDMEVIHTGDSFKYFDVLYEEMKIRCMFYGGCPGADTDEFLYKNTDLVQINNLTVPVQSLEFYYENAEKNTVYYEMTAKWLQKHKNYRGQNKKAWEYSAYEFWLQHSGAPSERARKDIENPLGMLKKYVDYFDSYANVRIANICGSCGKKAIPLAVLGAEVTVFDFSEDNRKYALEVAAAANVTINYEVCDVLNINMEKYENYFDVVFMEGGILHYFHNIDEFMHVMYTLLKQGGKMICSDFHPFTKISDILDLGQPVMSYFSTDVFEGEMAHARFYEEAVRNQFPKCLYRKYTISEIINSVINSGFTLEKFDEHPAWTNDRIPGEFTVVAIKSEYAVTQQSS